MPNHSWIMIADSFQKFGDDHIDYVGQQLNLGKNVALGIIMVHKTDANTKRPNEVYNELHKAFYKLIEQKRVQLLFLPNVDEIAVFSQKKKGQLLEPPPLRLVQT